MNSLVACISLTRLSISNTCLYVANLPFPRFERTPEGWYKPKYGHEEEMQYRADMRKKDQDELVKKRNTKRAGRKAKEAAPAPSANV